MTHYSHIYWIMDNKVISLGNIIILRYSITNRPVNVITTPEFLYIPSIISYYMFRSLVWPSSFRKKMQVQKRKMLEKKLPLPSPPFIQPIKYSKLFVYFWRDSPPPHWARASSFTRFLDHTQRGIAVGMTPLSGWSALRRDLYLTTHNTH